MIPPHMASSPPQGQRKAVESYRPSQLPSSTDLSKVISGGQQGADQAGLFAAWLLNIPTGGWAPKGWLTSTGADKTLLHDIFGLEECSGGYKERTYWNVRDSDATIRFALDFSSPGEKCTLKAIVKYNKFYLDVDLYKPLSVTEIRNWILEHKINILNIAGNRQRNSGPDIYGLTFSILYQVFSGGGERNGKR